MRSIAIQGTELDYTIVGFYGVNLWLLMPSVLSIGGFGELGEQWYGRHFKKWNTGLTAHLMLSSIKSDKKINKIHQT